MDRRQFLATGLLACSAAANPLHPSLPLAAAGEPDSVREPTPFRTVTYNILAARGYPERKENRLRLQQARKRMAERFALELAVYDPDLVTFQESPAESVVALIAKQMNMAYEYFPGGFPGSLLTKHKIAGATNCPQAGEDENVPGLFSRHWGRATLQVRDTELIVYTAHLHPSNAQLRLNECAAMLGVMKQDLTAGKNVILQGDLNDTPDSEMYRRLEKSGLQDAFAVKGTGEGLTCSTTNLRMRIDYVWTSGPISNRLNNCRVLAEGPFIDHPNDPAGFALSDHLPVLAEFGW